MGKSVNKELHELSKEYIFEYELLVEKAKVYKKNPKKLPEGSINESTVKIKEIKDKILGLLIQEITNESRGEDETNTPQIVTNKKPSFKMEF